MTEIWTSRNSSEQSDVTDKIADDFEDTSQRSEVFIFRSSSSLSFAVDVTFDSSRRISSKETKWRPLKIAFSLSSEVEWLGFRTKNSFPSPCSNVSPGHSRRFSIFLLFTFQNGKLIFLPVIFAEGGRKTKLHSTASGKCHSSSSFSFNLVDISLNFSFCLSFALTVRHFHRKKERRKNKIKASRLVPDISP